MGTGQEKQFMFILVIKVTSYVSAMSGVSS